MTTPHADEIGKRYGLLVVVALAAPGKHSGTYWMCRCNCGTSITVRIGDLHGKRRSCGCLRYGHDLTGQRFGRLTAVRRLANTRRIWDCMCDCGASAQVPAHRLQSGHTRSCGCLVRDTAAVMGSATRRHGHAVTPPRTPTYRTWMAMKARCQRPTHGSYSNYGGRGITVCERWQSFENFLADMGERPPGRSLDRIDGERGYEPGNCRWATPKEQAADRRRRTPKTHCKHGHEFTPENTYTAPRGNRECRTCSRIRSRARYAARDR